MSYITNHHCTALRHCKHRAALFDTCYFSSLMILSAQGIGLDVMGVNPVTSTGARRLLLDLAAHRVFFQVCTQILNLQFWPHNRIVKHLL